MQFVSTSKFLKVSVQHIPPQAERPYQTMFGPPRQCPADLENVWWNRTMSGRVRVYGYLNPITITFSFVVVYDNDLE
jgi:hypothetical protein